jgi:hypothetical protein
MNIPSLIIAGDTASWIDNAFADSANAPVDSTAYTLTYSFRGSIPAGNVDVTAVVSGNGWKTSLTSAQTAAMNTGNGSVTVYWHAVATKSGARVTAGNGTLFLKPNIAALQTNVAFDGRSQAEIDLAAVRTEMTARISGGATLEYSIGNRSLKKEPMAALMEMEQRCLRIVAREKRASSAANGLGNPGRTSVRFA